MNHVVNSSISVQELLVGVQQALRAVVPVADNLGVQWREPTNYLDWDAVAKGIYEGFALAAIRSSSGWEECLSLIAYDRRVGDYKGLSYVAVECSGIALPLICFETIEVPFDACLIAEIDSEFQLKAQSRIPIDECRFVAVGRLSDGSTNLIDKIVW